jgi:hypothetical protein
MAWQANVTIHNNTNYGLEIGGVGAGNTNIGPNSSTNWSSQDVNNTKSLYFPSSVAPVYMQGNLSFGPESGVYVDRGWMEPSSQLITMTAEANGTSWTQTENGGKTLLAWNQFENGGDIVLAFDEVNK